MPAPARRPLPHQVRIIGGNWKRTKLEVPDRPGLRPTPDRVRETLFNWLGQDLAGWRCVDAFAGTGALGLEAASRGAADVLLVESDGGLVDALRSVVQRLHASQVRVQRGNALTVLAGLPAGGTDLVFLDPPFDADLFDKALAAAVPALAPQGFIYLEAPTPWSGEALARHGLELLRHLKAGAVHGHLLRRTA
ncbi:16S rRNA (guanine(966)-N(2))-methyltransferase RsmD [Ramlibacter sp. AN1133]|uniref:16S rRNA (guanine(966)-N(2))-methyltransferase RsmD n=1 Tax=Ramlibacter sp. AN1133 TaxID=3133429 RepID=UPI0030BA38E0